MTTPRNLVISQFRNFVPDGATQHRVSAVFALGFASAAVTALGAVYALDLRAGRFAAAVTPDYLPDGGWAGQWFDGAVSAPVQQRAAADQWLHVVLIFGCIAAAVACINALIGLVAHANERRYETAVRGLVGASPRELRSGFRRGALLNALLGIGAGAPLGMGAAVLMRRSWPAAHGADPSDGAFLVLAFLVCTLFALLAAHYAGKPVRRTRFLGDALAPGARTHSSWGAQELRALLQTAQLACAIALTITGALIWAYASDGAAATQNIAHDRYVARVSGVPHTTVLAQLRGAGVEAESIASPGALLGIGKVDKVVSECGRCVRANMIVPFVPVATQQHVVGAGFFAVAGIEVQRGREFGDPLDDEDGVVISETFARLAFDTPNPLGKRVLIGGFGGTAYRIIGIVADVPARGLQLLQPDPLSFDKKGVIGNPAIYFSAATHQPRTYDVIVRGARPTLAGVSFQPLMDLLLKANAPQGWFARMLLVLGVLLCSAALAGTFVSATLAVRARTTEIALRRAVGARTKDIWLLVYSDVVRITVRAMVTGVIVAIALTRVFAAFVPGMPTFDLRITLLVCSAFAVVVFAAAYAPARAALRIAPARAEG